MKRSSSPEISDSLEKKQRASVQDTDDNVVVTTQDTRDTPPLSAADPASSTKVEGQTTSADNDDPATSANVSDPADGDGDASIPSLHSMDEEKPDNAEDGTVDDKEGEKTDDDKKSDRWQLVPTTVRQRMNYLLTTSKLSDCTVLVGKMDTEQLFHLHTVVLSMSSPVFEDLLQSSRDAVIPDVEPEVFKQVLEYIYLDYVNLWSVEKTQALYRASVRFKLPHLCEKAVEYLMAKMSLDSIWPIFDAAISTQDQILTDECNKFFKKNISDLLKHPNFKTVDHSVIVSLVSDDSLGVSEADLVSGVLKWAHQKCQDLDLVPNMENKRAVLLPETINNLRFLALSKEFFASQVAYSKSKGDESILTLEESYSILMNMVLPNSYQLPEGFNSVMKPRTTVELARLVRRIFNPLGTYQAVTSQSPRLDKLTVLPGPSLTSPFGCKNFSLDLIINKNISLFGIQVPTFFPGMIGGAPKLYEETYIVSIQISSKPNKPMIGSLNWSGKVTYNSFVDLLFKEPIRLEKGNTYTVMVYTNNTYYLNQKMCTVEDHNGIKFTFKDSVTLFGKPTKQDFAFIAQLIYSV